MAQVKSLDVHGAVHPMVAVAAKRDDVVGVKTQGLRSGPWSDVVRVNTARAAFFSAAIDAPIVTDSRVVADQ